MNNRIILSTVLLGLLGLLMIYSASNIWAEYKMGSEFYYLYRQGIFFLIGIAMMIIFSKIDYKIYYKYAKYFFLFGILLLCLVLIPGVGSIRGGARSWIGIGSFSFQPSEFMKLACIIFFSKIISDNHVELGELKNFIIALLILSVIFFLIMLEPDFGTGMVLVLSIIFLFLIRGIKIRWIIFLSTFGILLIVLLIILAPYRLERINSFLNPWSDPLGSGFQSIQSLYALSPGGIFGLGLFKSRQKFFYLPEPQTDFIFAIIIEELGLIGALFIFLLFFVFFYNAILVAINSKSMFSFYLSLGLTAMIFIQFFINISVVIGLIPVTGVTLPFLSYGGSSLVLTFISVGIILNIGKEK